MKGSILRLMKCTKCGNNLTDSGDSLVCKCGMTYPIINKIPRMLRELKGQDQPKDRFEFQWRVFGNAEKIYGRSEEQEFEDFFKYFASKFIKPEYFKNKLVLDAGCGHGRYVRHIAKLEAEVIGIDIGDGVEMAREKVRQFKNAQIMQADILDLPFREGTFDYVISLGVIHHTPDARQAFKNLAKLIKSGGWMAIWVAPKGGVLWETVVPAVRSVTTRLPPEVLYYMSYLAVPLLYFVPTYSGTSPRKNKWKECVQCIYDYLSPKYQSHHSVDELVRWFEEEGFEKIEVLPINTSVAGLKK